MVACGIETRVIPGRPAVDIGMLVSPEMRGNGYGTHMAAYVKDEVQRKGMSPICGCAASNVASYRALLKAGFRAEHHILRIELGNA